MGVSPNNASFLLNMSFPYVSFVLVLKAFGEFSRNAVFLINIVNQNNVTSEPLNSLLNSMQGPSYGENLSDLAAEI
jgi:hypothetical protein